MVDELAVEAHSVGDVVQLLRALSDPTRLRLLGVLQGGESNVTALCRKLRLPQPTVSHHLGLLRTAGLVANRRDGKLVYYSLNGETVSRPAERGALSIVAGPVELQIRTGLDGEGS